MTIKRTASKTSGPSKTKSLKQPQKKSSKKASTKKQLNETFYYDRKKLIGLAIFNVFLVLFIYKMTLCLIAKAILTSLVGLSFLYIVLALALLALLGSTFVAIYPLRLALITDKEIIIDHNEPLKWSDITVAKEFKASYLYPQHAIALHTKDGLKHNLTFMQKVCKNNVFTPFSIPLYAMTPKDASKITKIIKQKVKYENQTK